MYHTTWKSGLNVKETLSLTFKSRKPLAITLSNPACSEAAPHLPEKPCRPIIVNTGLHTITSKSLVPQQTIIPPLAGPSLASTSQITELVGSSGALGASVVRQLAYECVADDLHKTKVSKKLRQGWTCRKCGILGCPGRKTVTLCKNQCQDCGKVDCIGRNPCRPSRLCKDAWIDND